MTTRLFVVLLLGGLDFLHVGLDEAFFGEVGLKIPHRHAEGHQSRPHEGDLGF